MKRRKPPARSGPEKLDLVHGIAILGFNCDDEAHKLAAFMNIFHPERGVTTVHAARKMREEPEENYG